jgi:hypothetical protein
MKKILVLVSFLLSMACSSFGQVDPFGGPNSSIEALGGFFADSGFSLTIIDTSKPPFLKGNPPTLFGLNKLDSIPVYYYRNHWVEITTSTTGGLAIGSHISGGTANRGLYQNSSNNLAESSGFSYDGTTFTASNIAIADGGALGIGTGTGTIIGTASSKIGFFGLTAATQPTGNIVNALGALGIVKFPTIPESQLTFSDITTNNSSTLMHGFLPKLSGTATQYLGGDGNWTTPAGTTYSADGTTLQTSGTVFSIKLSTANTWTSSSGTTFNHNALGAANGVGVIISNTTASNDGAPEQWSPSLQFTGTGSDGAGGASSTYTIDEYLLTEIDSRGDVKQKWDILTNGSGRTNLMALTNSGGLVTAGGITATAGSLNISAGNISASSGGVLLNIVTKTTTYPMTTSDYTVLANTASGSFTVTLPGPGTCTGQIFNIKKISAANTLTIATSSGNIDGSTTLTVTSNNQNVQVQSNGTNYFIL